jgi:hypothetical protein
MQPLLGSPRVRDGLELFPALVEGGGGLELLHPDGLFDSNTENFGIAAPLE